MTGRTDALPSRALHLTATPTGAVCNLDCDCCFLLSSDQLCPGSPSRMDDAVLEAYLTGPLAEPGRTVLNTLQTNDTLIDDEWAVFLRDRGLLVGGSIDRRLEHNGDVYSCDHFVDSTYRLGNLAVGRTQHPCAGYLRFFRHVDEPMPLMASALREGRDAADAVQQYAAPHPSSDDVVVGHAGGERG